MKVHLSAHSLADFSYSPLFKDFVAGRGEANAYLGQHSRESVLDGAARIKPFAVKKEVLRGYNPFELTSAQQHNYDLLVTGKARVVVTGQQVCAFGGPEYVLFKAVSAIVLSQQWSEITGEPVVPVFFLADEDHDINEVTELKVPAGSTWTDVQVPVTGIPGTPAASFKPDSAFCGELLDKVLTNLRDEQEAVWFKEHALPVPGETMLEWFRRLMNTFFAGYGLLFIGSGTKDAKSSVVQELKTALSAASKIQETLESTSRRLEQVYHRQAQVSGSVLFYLDDEGRRVKLENAGNNKLRAGTLERTFSGWMQALESEPWRFSPNVFLRPILQDALMPVLGFVGGPGELGYHAQMGGLYGVFSHQRPVMCSRLCATVLDASEKRVLDESGWTPGLLTMRMDELEKLWMQAHGAGDAVSFVNDADATIKAAISAMLPKIGSIDATLVASAERIGAQTANELEKLAQKLNRALKQKDEVRLNKIRKLKHTIGPMDGLQERTLPWLWLFFKYGRNLLPELITALSKSQEPFKKHQLITVEQHTL
jgi:bacillithiol biosynthesis cysteine-adding enzyme BshC